MLYPASSHVEGNIPNAIPSFHGQPSDLATNRAAPDRSSNSSVRGALGQNDVESVKYFLVLAVRTEDLLAQRPLERSKDKLPLSIMSDYESIESIAQPTKAVEKNQTMVLSVNFHTSSHDTTTGDTASWIRLN